MKSIILNKSKNVGIKIQLIRFRMNTILLFLVEYYTVKTIIMKHYSLPNSKASKV